MCCIIFPFTFLLVDSISGDGTAVNLDYLPSLKYAILRPLIQKGSDGVQDAVKFMVDYGLVREDLDHILELSAWPGVKDIFSSVDSKVKEAFGWKQILPVKLNYLSLKLRT